jgi:hypothetical protein
MPSPQNAAQTLEMLKEKLGIGRDKTHAVMGYFTTPEALVDAGKKVYGMGYRKLDAMSPFPVHGIDDAIGIPRSHLGWIIIFFAMAGLLTAQGLIYFVAAINDPFVIGGKPLFDFTYTIPVTFELTVLFTGISTTIGWILINNLPLLYHPTMRYRNAHRATDDIFILVIEATDPKFNPERTTADLRGLGAHDVEVVEG